MVGVLAIDLVQYLYWQAFELILAAHSLSSGERTSPRGDRRFPKIRYKKNTIADIPNF